jgi:hypothetical protein
MKQYLLSVWSTEGDPTPTQEEMEKAYKDVDAFNAELQQSGAWVFAGGLHPASTATVVRSRGGDVTTMDGPFAETKEQLGGFFLVEAKDMDEACEVASRFPPARLGTIEVRPVQELEHS